MQLVAIEIADKPRRIEQRPRPARREVGDLVESAATIFRVGCNYDRDVVVGQPVGPADFQHDIERGQFDAAAIEQKFDRRVAAHIGCRRQRQHTQVRRLHRARRTKQLMRCKYRLLNRKPGLLVAQQLRDQGKIKPLARFNGAVEQPGDQMLPQRAKIFSGLGRFRESGKADALSTGRPGDGGSFGKAGFALRPHRSQAPALRTAKRLRHEIPMGRHGRGGSEDRPRSHRRCRSSVCRMQNPR